MELCSDKMSRKDKVSFIVVIIAIVGYAVCLDGSENVVGRAVSLNSVFTGLLTLTGFLFSARTFITFKLNEAVYSKASYRNLIEKFQEDGAYNVNLYEPLKVLDQKLGKACLRCFITLFFVLGFLFLPKDWHKGTPLWEQFLKWRESTISLNDVWQWRHMSYLITQISTIAVFAVIFAIIVEIYSAISAVNRNIQKIIKSWEDVYDAQKCKPPSN